MSAPDQGDAPQDDDAPATEVIPAAAGTAEQEDVATSEPGPGEPVPAPEPDAPEPDADAPDADAPTAETTAPIPPPPAPSSVAPAVRAVDLQRTGSRGTVYGPLDLRMAKGSLTVVRGPQGSGRTSLLLTLGGRLVPDDDTTELVVLGQRLLGRGSRRRRTKVQRLAAIAGFAGIDELDDSVTVRSTLRERRGWLTAWFRPARRVKAADYAELAAPVFGDRPVPDMRTVVWDLDDVDVLLVRIMLAMVQEPRLLLVDEVDQVSDVERRQVVWERLAAIAQSGVTVVASSATFPETTSALAVEPTEVTL